MEIWKDIKGYEGRYKVSDMGRIKSIQFNKELIKKTTISHRGYELVTLKDTNGKLNGFSVHRLVSRHFIGESDLTVDHINSKKTDNRLVNLQYLTQSENNKKKNKCLFHGDGRLKFVQYDEAAKTYRVRFKWDGKEISGGRFLTYREAVYGLLKKLLSNQKYTDYYNTSKDSFISECIKNGVLKQNI